MFKDYLFLCIAGLLNVVLGVGFCLLEKWEKFRKINYWIKQAIFGVSFGILAIVGTHWGISINGAQINARDASVIMAGLMFGMPAGIIAGVIGGVERYIAVYLFDIGSFTQLACSISTVIAGATSGVLRKFLFDNKRCSALAGFLLAFGLEVFHLYMVFVTNMGEHIRAFKVVNSCTIPMVLVNSISVLIGSLIINRIDKREHLKITIGKRKLSLRTQIALGGAVLVMFSLSTLFLYEFQNQMAEKNTYSVLNEPSVDFKNELEQLISLEDDRREVEKIVAELLSEKIINEDGFMALFNQSYDLICTRSDLDFESVAATIMDVHSVYPDEIQSLVINDVDYYSYYVVQNGYYVVSFIQQNEANISRNIAIYVNTFLEIIAYALVFIDVSLVIKYLVNNDVERINNSLHKITDGDLDIVLADSNTKEFSELSSGINSTVKSLKGYIEEANTRMDKELALAKSIQTSVLPTAFPKRNDCDVYASMFTAKEVGGDFYDFYFPDRDVLAITIADVSGKGVPAALFMMRAKQILNSLTQGNHKINEVFEIANNNLCDNNSAGMFVTAWSSTIDLVNKKYNFANAGHNPPLIKHKNGKFEYLRSKPNLVLAGIENIKFNFNEGTLEPGDVIFLYTDGVTEAINNTKEQYGEERLQNKLNELNYSSAKDICDAIYADVEKFTNGEPQFDDITMVCFIYK